LGDIERQDCARRRREKGKKQREKGIEGKNNRRKEKIYVLPLNLRQYSLQLLFKKLLDLSFCGTLT
jgi:hypothetical protein